MLGSEIIIISVEDARRLCKLLGISTDDLINKAAIDRLNDIDQDAAQVAMQLRDLVKRHMEMVAEWRQFT